MASYSPPSSHELCDCSIWGLMKCSSSIFWYEYLMRSVAFLNIEFFLPPYTSVSLHAPSNTVGRNPICIPINEMQSHFHWAARAEIPLLTVPLFCCSSLTLSLSLFFWLPSLFFSSHSPHTFSLPFLASLLPSPFRHASIQLEPRPSEILCQWTWSSQQSSGRRSTRRRRRRTGPWRRRCRDWRLSWSDGGTVALSHWHITETQNIQEKKVNRAILTLSALFKFNVRIIMS